MGGAAGGISTAPTGMASVGQGGGGSGVVPPSVVNPNGSVYAGPMSGSPATGGSGYGSPFRGGYGQSMGGYGSNYGTPFPSQSRSFYGQSSNLPIPTNPTNPNVPLTRSYTYTPEPTMQSDEYGNPVAVQAQPVTMTYSDPYVRGGYSPNQQVQNVMAAGSPLQRQIATAYQQVLGRAPEAAGANYWTNAFQGQNLSQQEVNRRILQSAGGTDIGGARDYALSQMRGVRPSSSEKQFYQPVYQSQYTNYSRSPYMYSPSYSSGTLGNPFAQRQYGGSPYQMSMPYYAEGGDVDGGIASLLEK